MCSEKLHILAFTGQVSTECLRQCDSRLTNRSQGLGIWKGHISALDSLPKESGNGAEVTGTWDCLSKNKSPDFPA
jgi:hypothetical protein